MITLYKKKLELHLKKIYVFIPRKVSFLVVNVCNQGKNL
jgi:hypothetical protein